jgi:hypothetical protein
MNTPHIYKLTLLRDTENFKAGQVYIGQTSGKHKGYYTGGIIPRRLIAKYGRSIFKKDIIKSGKFNGRLLDSLEIHYIRLYNSQGVGLNLGPGGQFDKPKKDQAVYKYSLHGNYISNYKNAQTAAEECGLQRSGDIRSACNKNCGGAGGYLWRYEKHDKIEPSSRAGFPIYAYALSGNFVKEYSKVSEAAGDGYLEPSIYRSLNSGGKVSTKGVRFFRSKTDSVPTILPTHYQSQAIYQYSLDGTYIATYQSVDEAKRACNGRRHDAISKRIDTNSSVYGYQWRSYLTNNCGKYVVVEDRHRRKVCAMTLTGEFVESFNSITEAAKWAKVDTSGVVRACAGGKVSGGFKWKYIE